MVVIQKAQYWNKDRPSEQWNRVVYPEINSWVYDQLTFDKGTKIWIGAMRPSQQVLLEKLVSYLQQNKTRPLIYKVGISLHDIQTKASSRIKDH